MQRYAAIDAAKDVANDAAIDAANYGQQCNDTHTNDFLLFCPGT